MGQIVVSEQDCPGECVDRLLRPASPRQRAGEIVAGQEVVGEHLYKPAVEFHCPLEEPLLRDEFGQHPQHLDGVVVANEQFLEEVEIEVELAEATQMPLDKIDKAAIGKPDDKICGGPKLRPKG